MGRRMSEDVSSRRPSRISEESLRVRLDLICQDYSQVQSLSDPCELVQVCVEFLLALTKILPANVFAPEV